MHPFSSHHRGRVPYLAAALVIPLAVLIAPPAASATTAATAHAKQASSHPAWTQFQYDAAKTGWNRAEQSLTRRNVGTLAERWSSADGLAGSPIVVGERVFVTLDGQLTAFSRNTGKLLWQTALDGDVALPPGVLAYGDGRVVVTTSAGVEAVKAASGAVAWRNSSIGGSRGPTVDGDRVYLGSYDQHVYALSLETGKIKWATPTSDPVHSTVAVSGRTLYVGADDDLVALRTDTGTVRWRTPTGNVYGGGPAVRDGRVYLGVNLGGEGGQTLLFAVRASSGRILWQANIGGDVHSAPSVDANNVYIGVIGDEVFALDAKNGHMRWTQQVDGEVWSGIAIGGGVAYTTTDTSVTYGLNTTTGAVLWSVPAQPTGVATLASCAVTGGRLYVSYGSAGLKSYAPRRHHG